jgi:ankyrin repeat protein
MVMALYNGGAHLDFRSRDTLTPMHKSAIVGNEMALKCLLELGAFADVRDSRMLTPLFYAIVNSSSVQCIEYLLFNGSSVGTRDENNWQEVHHACKLGLSQHLDHLLYYGADINAKNNSGNTALHVCAIHNQENCARILLFRGCNKSERNLANQTAFDTAVITGNQLIADLIKNHTDTEVVPIKDRPFYNTKRRSIYVGGGGCDVVKSSTANTLSTTLTSNTIMEWNSRHNHNNMTDMGSSGSTTSSGSANGSDSVARSRSMPKMNDDFNNQMSGEDCGIGLYAVTGQAPMSSIGISTGLHSNQSMAKQGK